MRPFARLAFCVLGLLAATGCGEDEYGILIRAYGDTPSALLTGTTLRVTVRDLRTGKRSDPPPTQLERDACTPGEGPEGECTQEPRVPDHVRIAVQLKGPGQFMVHLTATGTDGTFTATRCYTVVGVSKSDVLLVGPVLAEHDGDADGWTAAETCQERGLEDPGCKDQCPDQWGLDCDDEDPATNPGAIEKCEDGADQDCDGEDSPCEDADGDGFNGCPPDPIGCCDPDVNPDCDPDVDPPCVDRSTCDCDDTNEAINPGVTESSNPADGLCDNGIDENCDGRQQGCDNDGDGVVGCVDGESGNCDCDDTNTAIYPGAPETPGGTCDGLDNNCNDLIDEVEECLSDDLDGDGSKVGDDCNDCAASMSPLEETTICADDIDEDCSLGGTNDGRRMPPGTDPCQNGDGDGDGYVGQAGGGTDCDDGDPTRYPGAPDDCRDAVDADCSGSPSTCATDDDGDGYNQDNDCDDLVAAVHPGVTDPCDGVDNDCDGVVDEDVAEGHGCILSRGDWDEIDFQSDLQHCGSCRHNCNPGCDGGVLCKADGCTEGECTCGGAGGRVCDGSDADFCCPDGCQNLTNDIFNCGRCGQVCEGTACQVPVCNNGVCGTENRPDGFDCGGRFCCDGECRGDCAPGTTSDQGCGDCGSQSRTCDAECAWGPYGACQGEGECGVGATRTQGCGNCGNQDSICQGNCSWGGWGVCLDQGPCAPGSQSSEGCGNCGTHTRTCANDCTWGGYGGCGGEGACAPGQVDSRACGNCGTQTRTCSGACAWGAWSACGGEGACAPGTTTNRGCGNCGSQSRTCQADCSWGSYGACGGEGVCSPGAVSSQGCGNCGSQSRTCSGACAWGAYGACTGEGACAPGATATQTCGNCGSQGRTCNASCQWPAWGACAGEGECAVGTGQEVPCNDCGNQHQTCDASCTWQNSGGCDNTPPSGNCGDGDVCTTDVCGATGLCTNTGCGGGTPSCCTNGCFACCLPGDCTDPGICRHSTCGGGGNGGTCGSANDADGTDDCATAGQLCCGGACTECCGADASACADPGVCRHAVCTGNACASANDNNGTDDCSTPGEICCGGACRECCGSDASTCTGNPPGNCRDWVCTANACAATGFVPAGFDYYNECGGGTPNCDGAGNCV